MEERDLPTVDAWVCAEGWRPARKDMEAYYAADPRGLWVLVSKSEVADQEEKIIGIIGTMCWGSRYGHIGLFIVAEAERGKGYGKQLWSHAVKVIRPVHISRNHSFIPHLLPHLGGPGRQCKTRCHACFPSAEKEKTFTISIFCHPATLRSSLASRPWDWMRSHQRSRCIKNSDSHPLSPSASSLVSCSMPTPALTTFSDVSGGRNYPSSLAAQFSPTKKSSEPPLATANEVRQASHVMLNQADTPSDEKPTILELRRYLAQQGRWTDIIEFDARFFPCERPSLLRGCLQQEGVSTIIALAPNSNRIVGIARSRQARDADKGKDVEPRPAVYRIAPMFAETQEVF